MHPAYAEACGTPAKPWSFVSGSYSLATNRRRTTFLVKLMKRLLRHIALCGISVSAASAQETPHYTAADVRFMQGMIGHHAQALVMTALIPDRTTRADIRALGQRIEVSQKDEIKMMQQWLRDRHQTVPNPEAQHEHHMDMPGITMSVTLMPGLLAADQLADPADTRGTDCDKLCLKD